MNDLPTSDRSTAARPADERAELERLIAGMRGTLSALQQDVAEAESRLGNARAARLVEANEQLVLAALRLQQDADTQAEALAAASLSARRLPRSPTRRPTSSSPSTARRCKTSTSRHTRRRCSSPSARRIST